MLLQGVSVEQINGYCVVVRGEKREEEALYTSVMQHLESLWDLITEYILEGLWRLGPDGKKNEKRRLVWIPHHHQLHQYKLQQN